MIKAQFILVSKKVRGLAWVIHCLECKRPFQFAGIEPGFNYDAPTVSLDGLEANLPIFPQGQRPNPMQKLMGYTIKGTN